VAMIRFRGKQGLRAARRTLAEVMRKLEKALKLSRKIERRRA